MSKSIEDCDYTSRLGHRQRLKNQLADAPDTVKDYELLELLLFYAIPRTDVQPLARGMIEYFGGFDKVFDIDTSELMEYSGVGESVATLVKIVYEIRKRCDISPSKKVKVLNRADAIKYIRPFLVREKLEQLHLICLDKGYRVLRHFKVEEGTADNVNVHINKICTKALLSGACYVILAHNHPSGDCMPSSHDDEVTVSITKALAVLSIRLVDHIIICDSGSYSYNKDNKLGRIFAESEKELAQLFIADTTNEQYSPD